MPNLRIIADNAADRATITTSSTAGSLTAANMKQDRKSKVWRSLGTTASITLIWATSEILSGLALPFCNLTATATIRVRGYTLDTDVTPLFDTGTNPAVGYSGLGLWDWGALPLGVNAYSYGGGAYATSWFSTYFSVKKLVIDLADTNNAAGYIECSRLVTGSAWSPTFNTSFGIPVSVVDSSTHARSDSGDLVTTRGTQHRSISFDLNWLNAADRQRFSAIMKGNGLPKPMFISLFPEDLDKEKEQTYQLYGKMPQLSALSHPIFTIYSGHIDIEEI